MTFEEMCYGLYCQSYRTIRNHSPLSHLKRLHIKENTPTSFENHVYAEMADEIRKLFRSLGPLDELTYHSSDISMLFVAAFDPPEFDGSDESISFPPTRRLAISSRSTMGVMDKDDIVELAKSRHRLGIPFEHLTICVEEISESMTESLREWVGVVDCYEQPDAEER
jgi:hypothetical protein